MKSMKDLKRFSKEWWKNFWFYYKWHLLIGAIVIVAITATAVDMANRVHPDIYILFSGDYTLTEEDTAILKERVEETITDVNGDGEIIANFIQIPLKLNSENVDETTAASTAQMQHQFVTGDQHIYVLDRELFNLYYSQYLLDIDTLMEETATNPLFEGTSLAERDAVMVTRYKRADMESDFTTSQQIIDRFATPNTKERFQKYVKEHNEQ